MNTLLNIGNEINIIVLLFTTDFTNSDIFSVIHTVN